MFINRPYWQELIEKAWLQKNIIWLMGVRRVGKTSLCQSLPNVDYFDCERPRVRQLFDDPEEFLMNQKGKRIVLDEIHRLDNPSEVLKLAADHYPEVKIIATGSSTLGASAKFKDTLTGRKKELWLTPMLLQELGIFGNQDIRHRLLFGGFPSFFASTQLPEDDFREWIDAYWAKDIQELFQVNKRYSFQKCAELLLAYSGGQFEASKLTAPCEVSRQTIANYVAILEETFVVHVIRPYSTHKPNEIIMAPKIYGFDTGFVCYAKGWRELRQEDVGLLWEQCVLNEIQAHLQTRSVNYWRNKQGHEIDFVIPSRTSKDIMAIECKFKVMQASMGQSALASLVKNIQMFRSYYKEGENLVVATDIDISFEKRFEDITITFVSVADLIKKLTLSIAKISL
ncbi:MAG: AAA family ATPase [Candidatus Dependentiae bacterium]|nr:AAA family ATPase [Candidatus Dependentiae bacterium]